MAGAFQSILEEMEAKDRALLQKAVDASRTAHHYHELASQNAAPTAEVISRANAMRVMQLGEAIKNLINGPIKVIDSKKEMLTPTISAEFLIFKRDELAHPDRGISGDEGTRLIFSEREALLAKFGELQALHPDIPDIASCMEALKHLSDDRSVSPTVWTDAENYMHVYRGAFLYLDIKSANISEYGKRLLDAYTDNMPERMVERRNRLSHAYDEHGGVIKFSSYKDPTSVLEQSAECLTVEAYRRELIGQREEPEIEDIITKWLVSAKGSPQASYGRSGRYVVEEISRLAKEGAKVSKIQELDTTLGVAKKSPPEVQKYVRIAFPKGVGRDITFSLDRAFADCKRDYFLQKQNKTSVLDAVSDKMYQVANELGIPQAPKALNIFKGVAWSVFRPVRREQDLYVAMPLRPGETGYGGEPARGHNHG